MDLCYADLCSGQLAIVFVAYKTECPLGVHLCSISIHNVCFYSILSFLHVHSPAIINVAKVG